MSSYIKPVSQCLCGSAMFGVGATIFTAVMSVYACPAETESFRTAFGIISDGHGAGWALGSSPFIMGIGGVCMMAAYENRPSRQLNERHVVLLNEPAAAVMQSATQRSIAPERLHMAP